jgi:hypothetical protein
VTPDDPERSMVRLRLKRQRHDGRQHLDFTQMESMELGTKCFQKYSKQMKKWTAMPKVG